MAVRLALALSAAAAAGAASLPRISLRVSKERSGEHVMVDETGAEVFLHGVNAIVKGPPYYPSRDGYDPYTSLVAEDFKQMRAHGVNFIRLGVMWPGAEPVKGQYNRTYLNIMKEISDEAAEYGIYTMADMHQDDLSERYCGEGIPLWAAQGEELLKFPLPVRAEGYRLDGTGIPTRQECAKANWPSYYASAACSSAFEKLYTTPLTDDWGAFWKEVAVTYANSSNLLGFELINEPFVGGIYEHPDLLVPGVADELRLQPAYDKVAAYIREVSPDALILFAGSTWDRDGDPVSDNLPWGFKHAPGGESAAAKSLLAFHYYTPPQLPKDFKPYLETRKKDALKLKSGMFLTETFAWNGQTEVLEEAERLGISWGAWEYKDYCRETNATLNGTSQYAAWGACKTGYGGVVDARSEENTQKNFYAIARTYAQRVAGSFLTTLFNDSTSAFSLEYLVSRSVDAPTTVYFNPDRYPGSSMKIKVSPSEALNVTVASPFVHFRPAAGTPDRQHVTITIEKQ